MVKRHNTPHEKVKRFAANRPEPRVHLLFYSRSRHSLRRCTRRRSVSLIDYPTGPSAGLS
jgi:hypothetical protein